MSRTSLLACAVLAQSSTALAQTVLSAAGLTTPNAAAEQAAMCHPGGAAYPAEFTWAGLQAKQPRDAMASDKLTPRIEQHRLVQGADKIVAVWHSLSSNPNTCSEPFRTPPKQPASGQPYTAAQQLPFSPAALQAIANTGCGPFGNTSHVDLFRLWQPGDTFLVYPAVYTTTQTSKGPVSNNNITLHPLGDYYVGSGNPVYPPNNISIVGVTQNGIRPVIVRNDNGAGDSETSKDVVEIEGGANDTVSNISVTLGSAGYVLASGIYLLHTGYNDYDQFGNSLKVPVLGTAPNRTLISNTHVHGFEQEQVQSGGANGITADPTGGGRLELLFNQIDHNGGSGAQNSSGLAHGIYIDASNTEFGNATYDPDFTVVFKGNWFHDQFFGHDAKSRAQHTYLLGNYFQGGTPQGGTYGQAEAFNADVPNAGQLVARGNVFVKTMSGYNSGAFGLDYGEEGVPSSPADGPHHGPRVNSVDIEFNTFVAFSSTIDGQHSPVPMSFFYPQQVPDTAGFPVANLNVSSNAFVGYCPNGNAVDDYRGTEALTAGFGDMSEAFSFGGLFLSPDLSHVGGVAYLQQTAVGTRTNAAVGAEN